MKMLMLCAALIAGCVSSDGETSVQETSSPAVKATYLCVGMESSARFGSCPGCERDARRLASLMTDKFGYTGSTLISGEATRANVLSKLKEGIEATDKDGLFLFFYSGHGGQEYLGGSEPDDADDPDEYICLYDAHVQDDDLWDIVSRCRGRVFLYFDACHSATMYRSVSAELKVKGQPLAVTLGIRDADMIPSRGFTFRPAALLKARPMSKDGSSGVRLLCWSGCKEGEYSYGGSSGGVLTSAVIGDWKKGVSYGSLWEEARSRVSKEQPGQHPVQTYVGGGFSDTMEAFR